MDQLRPDGDILVRDTWPKTKSNNSLLPILSPPKLVRDSSRIVATIRAPPIANPAQIGCDRPQAMLEASS